MVKKWTAGIDKEMEVDRKRNQSPDLAKLRVGPVELDLHDLIWGFEVVWRCKCEEFVRLGADSVQTGPV